MFFFSTCWLQKSQLGVKSNAVRKPGRKKVLYFWPVSAMLSINVQSHFTLSLHPACNTTCLHGRTWEIADVCAVHTCNVHVHISHRQLKGDRNCAGFVWRILFMLIGCKRKPLHHRIPLSSEMILLYLHFHKNKHIINTELNKYLRIKADDCVFIYQRSATVNMNNAEFTDDSTFSLPANIS